MKRALTLFAYFTILTGCSSPLPTNSELREDPYIRQQINISEQLYKFDITSKMINGYTLVLGQPFANTKEYNIHKIPIYFKPDGYAYSKTWEKRPWYTSQGKLCIDSDSAQSCYFAARKKSNKQAYFYREGNNYLSQLIAREFGDSRRVRDVYQRRMQIMAEKRRVALAMTGAILDMMFQPPPMCRNSFGYISECY